MSGEPTDSCLIDANYMLYNCLTGSSSTLINEVPDVSPPASLYNTLRRLHVDTSRSFHPYRIAYCAPPSFNTVCSLSLSLARETHKRFLLQSPVPRTLLSVVRSLACHL